MKQVHSINGKTSINVLNLFLGEMLLYYLVICFSISSSKNSPYVRVSPTVCDYDVGNPNRNVTHYYKYSFTTLYHYNVARQYLQRSNFAACWNHTEYKRYCIEDYSKFRTKYSNTGLRTNIRRKNMSDFGEKNEINEILKLVRIAQDLSPKEVADRMNVRSSYITDVERGDRNPNLKTLDKYCTALNISTDNLFLWREDQKKNRYTYRRLLMKLLQAIEEIDERQKREKERLVQLKEEYNNKNSKSLAN